jgi:hypothetical protein
MMSLNCGNQWAYCLSPRWYMSMENHEGMILAGELLILQLELFGSTSSYLVVKQEEHGKGSAEFVLMKYLFHTRRVM